MHNLRCILSLLPSLNISRSIVPSTSTISVSQHWLRGFNATLKFKISDILTIHGYLDHPFSGTLAAFWTWQNITSFPKMRNNRKVNTLHWTILNPFRNTVQPLKDSAPTTREQMWRSSLGLEDQDLLIAAKEELLPRTKAGCCKSNLEV